MQANSGSYMGSWNYAPAADLGRPFASRLRQFPREPDVLVYGLRFLAAVLMRSWVRVYHRLQIRGQENLPLNESFVMVANHSSHLDTLCLLASLPLQRLHRAFPVAAQDYFFRKTPRTALAAITLNAMPFNRQTQVRRSLGRCREILWRPRNIVILFPEGTRSNTGEIGEFKAGIGMLVAGTEIPVVPCSLSGTFAAWPKGTRLPRPAAVRLTIGSPRQFKMLTADRESARQIARELRRAVIDLNEKEEGNEHD